MTTAAVPFAPEQLFAAGRVARDRAVIARRQRTDVRDYPPPVVVYYPPPVVYGAYPPVAPYRYGEPAAAYYGGGYSDW